MTSARDSPPVRGTSIYQPAWGRSARRTVDRGIFGAFRQLEANLAEARGEFSQGVRAVLVEFEPHGNGAHPGRGFRIDVVDAGHRGRRAFDNVGDKPLHRFGGGADEGRRDLQPRAFDHRELQHGQLHSSTETQEQQSQADHHRDYGAADENIGDSRLARFPGDIHDQSLARSGTAGSAGATRRRELANAPSRSLKEPSAATR